MTTTLRDLTKVTLDGVWGDSEPSEGTREMRVIRGTDFEALRRGDVTSAPIRHIQVRHAKRKKLLPGDILIETAGGSKNRPTGRTTLITEEVLVASSLPLSCASFARFIRIDTELAEPAYIYWVLQDLYSRGELTKHQVQHTGVARFQFTDFSKSPFPELPIRHRQRQIASLLNLLDRKIAVNHRQSRTLEEIAQTLFRAWFVSFTDSSDSRKPLPLAEIAESVRETADPQELEPDTPYIGLGDMTPGTITDFSWGRAAEAKSTKRVFKKGDILFGKLRPYFKKIAVAPFDGVCSSDIVVVKPKEDRWLGVVLGLLTLDEFISYCEGASTGTRMPRVSWKTMAKYVVEIPEDTERVTSFNALMHAMIARIAHNILESQTLAQLRDLLLPKLISGELRIPDAEDLVQEAV